jgi:hypothetical protein
MKRETIFKLAVVAILGACILTAERAFAGDCQDVGLAKEEQAIYCMYVETAQMSFMVSASMVCEDGPDYPSCAQRKADLFRQGMILLKRATDIADEKRHRGLLKKLFKKVW